MYIHPLYHWPPKSTWRDATTDGAFEWADFGAYIHFPFCRNICSFCNYETRLIDKKSATAWASSVHREIDEYLEQKNISRACVRSLFFGGGTASLVPIDVVSSLVSRMAGVNGSKTIAEVTLECEPGTIDRARLKAARDAGVNRLGVCAQSFDDEMLRRLTRQHTSADVYKLIESALDVGFENIHLDLMYGLPGQDSAHWERTLETALSLPFTHISAYKFYVFRHGQIDREGIAPRAAGESDVETSRLADMHTLTIETLASGGFDQYSLTEYAKPGFICDYLARTFGGGDILPIGPSAFGRQGTQVWQNSLKAWRATQRELGRPRRQRQ